ncbi:MAG: hypothetical protein A2406_04555 [Candidatus Komeilibacteria bacterium RIFOXYC1_FULL_37_11]|uniref:Uncharacterized protein n=1 Tax=Candidatus Komeilibacteria bacterium RIFOXYC1_FULL_37_11 TaxID=1798555 RepID=A0A1G2C0T7_9BACT|nr:MAG: hypothetical protein A2406_04555 [Candidatus Komeilibacteria bacterium RIFOXYC1_FULL_37_11]OGY95385.1 MAG: hypothetical protein A2611_01655 [Candidatus Komeilibacteria bacterium RIFOXYD1_FULL_37_29]
MHDLGHIKRVQKIVLELAANYPEANLKLINLSLYFHGVIHLENGEKSIISFLQSKGMSKRNIDLVIRIAWDSEKNTSAETIVSIEGKIAHDAHLLEGGKTFLIVKTLCTGVAIGKTLEESLQYLQEQVLGKFHCLLPEAQELYALKEAYANDFLHDLQNHL